MTQSPTSSPEMTSILEPIRRQLGFIPNLLDELKKNPAVLRTYLQGQQALASGMLSPREQQAVQLRVSVMNQCTYCQAAHRWLGKQVGLTGEEIQTIERGEVPPKDTDLAGVIHATSLLFERKGWLNPETLQMLERQGVSREKLYEIIAYIGLKTISNYINHVAHTPIDSQFTSSGSQV
ncbi:MAG: carboxymuconolactone decarboxylase family protein [Nitrospirae bacterium]|nr:MAG: carboxymuconolactone decarboxylase family protein [Nitrospirota bacterium]